MTHIDDITHATTTDALSDLLAAFCDEQGLPFEGAQELLLRVVSQREWLKLFCERWDDVQAQEDFEHACQMRGV